MVSSKETARLLLFVIIVIPLFVILRKAKTCSMVWETIFFMDDLKLFETTKIRLVSNRQKLVRSKGEKLPVDEIMKVLKVKIRTLCLG